MDWTFDIAEVSRGKMGGLHIHSTWAQDDSNTTGGAAFGAITGALLGVMAGPGGVLAGLIIGGTTGALLGTALDLDLDDPVLDEYADSLIKDTSSLILVADGPAIKQFGDAVDELDIDATVYETKLSEKDVEKLKNSLKKHKSHKKAA